MEQKHQDIIKRNYSVLVKKMTATWVAERLFEDGIITAEMKENIITQQTGFEQSRKLISFILRRGSKAFIGFRKALLKSGHHDLSRLFFKRR